MEHGERWIWDERTAGANLVCGLRKRVILSDRPISAPTRVTADSRYRLWVNGRPAARGPARSDPARKHVDELDLAPYLRPGENVIAVLAHHLGVSTHSYQLGAPGFLFRCDPVFADGAAAPVVSDRSWRVGRIDAWDETSAQMWFPVGFQEIWDARRTPPTWMRARFDDSAWAAAREIGPPGVAPWTELLPRGIPQECEQPVAPTALVEVAEAYAPEPAYEFEIPDGHDRLVVRCFLRMGGHPSGAVGGNPGPVTVGIGGTAAVRTWWRGAPSVRRDGDGEMRMPAVAAPIDVDDRWGMFVAELAPGAKGARLLLQFRSAGPESPVVRPMPGTPARAAGSPGFMVAAGADEPGIADAIAAGDAADVEWKSLPAEAAQSRDLAYEAVALEARATIDCEWEDVESLVVPAAEMAPRTMPARVRVPPGRRALVTVDFGREILGYLRLQLRAGAGTTIDLAYAEDLDEHGRIRVCKGGDLHYCDRYIARRGRQRYETLDKRAFRYLRLAIGPSPTPTEIESVDAVLATYPVEPRGRFASADPRLDRIWEIGRHTLRLCMEDAFTDCPWRERGQWEGDARVEAFVNYYAFGDRALPVRSIRQIGDSDAAGGFTRCLYPAGGDAVIPGFSLHWLMSIEDLVMHIGDLDTATALLPRVDRMMDAFERCRRPDGLIGQTPGWAFTDWSGHLGHPPNDGRALAVLNAFHVGGFEAVARVAAASGDPDRAQRYAAAAERTRTRFDAFWRDDRGMYADWIGADGEAWSQHANALALLYGLAPPERQDRVAAAVLDPAGDVVPIGTPYFGFYVLAALERIGRFDDAVAMIQSRWGAMMDAGATTWWEQWTPQHSLCHAWSAAPTAFLSRIVIGIRPLAPGFARYRVDPRPGGLGWARGRVPTPAGPIDVDWARDGVRFRLTVRGPAERVCEASAPVAMDGVDLEIRANGRRVAGPGQAPTGAYRDGDRWVCELRGGGLVTASPAHG